MLRARTLPFDGSEAGLEYLRGDLKILTMLGSEDCEVSAIDGKHSR